MIAENFAKDRRVWAELAIIVMLAFVLAFGGVAQAQNTQILLAEDFEGLQLGPNVEERLAGEAVWTDTPPGGWTNDVSGVTQSLGRTKSSRYALLTYLPWKAYSQLVLRQSLTPLTVAVACRSL